MTIHLPDPTPTATAAGQAPTPLTDAVIQAAVENAIDKARRADTTPQVVIGNTPPVEQPGIPAQSGAAVDYAVRVLATGVATAISSGGISLVLLASQAADPVVCGIVFGAPIGLAVPIAALASVMKRAKETVKAAPPVHHHHYTGTVQVHEDNRTVNNRASGVWASARSDNPS